jgi:hypothetical protein
MNKKFNTNEGVLNEHRFTYFVSNERYYLEFVVTLYWSKNVETHQNEFDFKIVFNIIEICPLPPNPTQKCKVLIFSYLFKEEVLSVF